MPVQFYMPRSEAELVVWFVNWAAKLQVHGTSLGATAGEKAQALVDAVNVALLVNTLTLYKTFLNEWVEFKNSMLYAPVGTALPVVPIPTAPPAMDVASLAAILKRTAALNERLRVSPQYTIAIGQDLNIIGPELPPLTQPGNVKAIAQAAAHVRINFNKGGFSGVVIYSKRGAETAFTFLSVDTATPYFDTRDPLVAGQPENRTYRLRLYDGENPVGEYSGDVSVVTLP